MLPAAVYLNNTKSYVFNVVVAMHGTTAAINQLLFVTATNCVVSVYMRARIM